MKVIIFSHESDIDGIGSIILGKLAFGNIDFELLPNPKPLELKFREYINNKKIYEYDKIFITDLALENPSLEIVSKDDVLKSKVKVFDHHERAIELGLNKYDFTFIEEEQDGIKRCGTEMFYKYLVDNNCLKSNKSLDKFVEFTRLEDTWDWKRKGIIEAHDLAILFNSIGIDKYIELMLDKLSKEDFIFTNEEQDLINNIKESDLNNIKEYLSKAEYLIDEDGNKFGITFSPYKYRNDLPEYVRNNNINNVKYFITVSLDKDKHGQKSYRSIDRSCDVNKIAMKYNGGGHPCSAGVSITEEQNKKIASLSNKEALEYISKCKYENI
ncbi:MAG: hypothetical protein J5970_05305 [Bacilli bacterium]|nr:hypothetical protein [Bacilli bacterium]